MNPQMKAHFVAFLDILGFKAMVESEMKSGDGKFLKKLFDCHVQASEIFTAKPDLSIIQFSDSIVITQPYSKATFPDFIKVIADYQRYLLLQGLLCRGGVAVNQHFSNGTFTFSAGLIDAYKVESENARYPRVVISQNVIDLVAPDQTEIPGLILEDDGLHFIDYLKPTKKITRSKLSRSTQQLSEHTKKSQNPSIREKGIWLASYSDYALETSICPKRFTLNSKPSLSYT